MIMCFVCKMLICKVTYDIWTSSSKVQVPHNCTSEPRERMRIRPKLYISMQTLNLLSRHKGGPTPGPPRVWPWEDTHLTQAAGRGGTSFNFFVYSFHHNLGVEPPSKCHKINLLEVINERKNKK